MSDVAAEEQRTRVDVIREVLDDYFNGVDDLADVDTDDLAESIDINLQARGGVLS